MQRRITALAAVSTMLAVGVLAGCSNNAGGGEQTLTLYVPADMKEQIAPVFDAFEEQNPGVKINATYAAGDETATTLLTQLSAGSAADIVQLLPGGGGNPISVGSLVANGYLADLSDEAWAKDIPESQRPMTDIDGKTYSFPGWVQPLGAFYNTATLEEAGLEPPTTWSELLDFCSDATAAGMVAFSLGIQDSWVGQLVPYGLVPTLVYREDPEWNLEMVDGQATFPDSNWATAFDKYMEMNDAGCFSSDPNGISFDSSLPPVTDGSALGIVQVGGVYGTIRDLNESAQYELYPLPATDDADETWFAGAPSIGFGINAKAKNPELAQKFLALLAEPEYTNLVSEAQGGTVPAIPNDDFVAPELLTRFNEYVAEGRVAPFPDTGWPNSEIQNAMLVGLQGMFLGSTTSQQVLESMQSKVEN